MTNHFRGIPIAKIIETDDDLMAHSYPGMKKTELLVESFLEASMSIEDSPVEEVPEEELDDEELDDVPELPVDAPKAKKSKAKKSKKPRAKTMSDEICEVEDAEAVKWLNIAYVLSS